MPEPDRNMSLPRQPETPGIPEVSDQQLVRYVLGLLPDDETERLDEASIADDGVAERLRIVEDDLIDAYLRGTLDPSTLERFESYYLSSPERREHVRFAASLVRAVDCVTPPTVRSTAAAGPPAPSLVPTVAGSSPSRARVRSWLVPGLAVAAVLLLAASAALLSETTRLNRGLSAERQQNAALDRRAQALERQLEAQRTSAATTASELARARESGATSTSNSASGAGRAGASGATPGIALVLLPQTRAIGPIPTLALASGADRVAFDLRLETNDFHEYQVGLRDPATNDVIWRSEWMTPRTSSDQPSVSLAIPAGLLKAQHYSIELTGRDGAGTGQVVGSYAFQIVPR